MKILDLYITKICNLNCEYCYVDLVSDEVSFNQEVVTKRIELLKYDHIKFFGGEPLLKYSNIKSIVESIKSKNVNTKFSIVTNWLLLNEEKLLFCMKYEIEIIISVHKKGFKNLLPSFWSFLQCNNLIGFSFIFEPEHINFPRRVIEKLIKIGFINFTLTPEVYSNWDDQNLKKLQDELNLLLRISCEYWAVNFKGIDGEYLKTPVVGCEKTIMNTDWKISLCNRFKKLDLLKKYNYKDIHNIFNDAIWYSDDQYKWFYVCPIGWFLDQIEDAENFQTKILQYKSLNRVFIDFHKSVNKEKDVVNFLSDGIQEIRFNLTSQCNIRCEYCYVDFKNDTLDIKVAKNIIDFYMLQEWEEKILSFFGWEPLLEYKSLEELVLYSCDVAKKYKKKIRYIIATNFLLMNELQAIFLKKHEFEFHISCNGQPKINNHMRDNSSHLLFANINKFKHIIPLKDISLLLAFSQKEVWNIYENIKFFHELGFQKVNLELIANHDKYKWEKDEIILLKKELLKIKSKDLGLEFLNLREERKFIDVSVEWRAWENSFEFHKYSFNFKMKKIFDALVNAILK